MRHPCLASLGLLVFFSAVVLMLSACTTTEPGAGQVPPALVKGANVLLVGTWGTPDDPLAAVLIFRADATASVNLPDADGRVSFKGEFQYEISETSFGQGRFFRMTPEPEEHGFTFHLVDAGQRLIVGLDGGPDWLLFSKKKVAADGELM